MIETYVSRRIDSTTHDDYLLDFQESLGILSSSDGKIGQRSDCHNGNRIGFVLPQQVEHDFVCRLQRWREERVFLLDLLQRLGFFSRHVLRLRREERLPCLFW